MERDRDWITVKMDEVSDKAFNSILKDNYSLVLTRYDALGDIEEVIEGYDSIKAYLRKIKRDERDNNKS